MTESLTLSPNYCLGCKIDKKLLENELKNYEFTVIYNEYTFPFCHQICKKCNYEYLLVKSSITAREYWELKQKMSAKEIFDKYNKNSQSIIIK